MNYKVNFRISDDLLKKGNMDSKSRGMSLSEHIRDLLSSYSVEEKPLQKDIIVDSSIGWKARLEEQMLQKKSTTASGK